MENKLFQKEMREKKALARTSSADTELNKSKSQKKDRLLPIMSEQERASVDLKKSDPFGLILKA